ncbi:MAG: sulfur oxidation c-type cytochrome SoxA [Chromatiales bacterium]|nr:sulfur oxidation c-type cytochrome SoxA [Chromatiales bacterium]
MIRKLLVAMPLAAVMVTSAYAEQTPGDVLRGLIDRTQSPYLTQSPQNVQMIDDSPAIWTGYEGGDLFKAPRGPNNVSMESCDFGKGPGVVKGAAVELPRYFADTNKVMDLEGRIVHCMTTVQGFAKDDPAVRTRHGSNSDMMKIMTYIAMESNGMPWNPPLSHPLEVAMRDAGEEMFFRRQGLMDFSCATCHGPDASHKRIRASVMSSSSVPSDWTKSVSWPAFRVGQQHARSPQNRVRGCYWQMRTGQIRQDSDAMMAILSYWTDAARGQPAILPDMKR